MMSVHKGTERSRTTTLIKLSDTYVELVCACSVFITIFHIYCRLSHMHIHMYALLF